MAKRKRNIDNGETFVERLKSLLIYDDEDDGGDE